MHFGYGICIITTTIDATLCRCYTLVQLCYVFFENQNVTRYYYLQMYIVSFWLQLCWFTSFFICECIIVFQIKMMTMTVNANIANVMMVLLPRIFTQTSTGLSVSLSAHVLFLFRDLLNLFPFNHTYKNSKQKP